jgi:hypothetical protein
MLQILSYIKMFWDMFGQVKAWLAAKRKADAEENKQKREEAIDQGQKATTPEEAYAAQEKFSNHKP